MCFSGSRRNTSNRCWIESLCLIRRRRRAEETLAEFVARIDPFLSQSDRLRMMTHQALQQNEEFFEMPSGL